VIAELSQQRMRLTKHRKVTWAKLQELHRTMQTLLPQIRYWIKTGWVAANKVVSLQIPEIYAIVRGKVGKTVEFGLHWGITRLRGGFLLATLAKDKTELVDTRFAVRAVEDHIARFGKPPASYAYDRGGWSEAIVVELKKLGVSHVGLAPRGKAKWQVHGRVKHKLVSERSQVEGGIGAIKSRKYGFNRPAAKSAAAMGGMWPTLRLGIQPEQADERIGGATRSRAGRVISCGQAGMKPPAGQARLPQKTMPCGMGEFPRAAAKLPGKLYFTWQRRSSYLAWRSLGRPSPRSLTSP